MYVYHGLADDGVFAPCDLMCGRLQAEEAARRTP
jgi:hypothetical protein